MLLDILLILAIAAALAFAVNVARRPLPAGSAISPKRDRRLHKTFLILTGAVAVLGVVPLAGMPGFLRLELTEPLGRMARPGRAWRDFQSGVSWPAAILMTPPWALSILLGYRLTRRATTRAGLFVGALAGLAAVVLAGVGLALFFCVLGCSW